MIKKLLMVALVLMVAAVSMAGCLQPQPSAPQAVPLQPTATVRPPVAQAQQTVVKEVTKVIVVPSAPAAKPQPQPATIQVYVTGPTTLIDTHTGTWTATVVINGAVVPDSQSHLNWYIDGHHAGVSGSSTLVVKLSADAYSVLTIRVEYMGEPYNAEASMTVTILPNHPTATPTDYPVA